MRVIGLTGGIASGKTMITDYMRSLGAPVIDADEISRELTARGSPVLDEISSAFGDDCLDEDGNLRRRMLGKIIFEDEIGRAKLNKIMHPKIEALVKGRISEYKDAGVRAVIYSAPLLLEARHGVGVDEIWVVALEPEEQIRRLRARDGLSPEDAGKRLRAQSSLDIKLEKADKIIDNNGSREEARRQAKALWEEALKASSEAERESPDCI